MGKTLLTLGCIAWLVGSGFAPSSEGPHDPQPAPGGGHLAAHAPAQADYAAVKTAAERHVVQGAYELAYRAYAALAPEDVPADERRWVAFRTADTNWRSAAGTTDQDTSRLDTALAALTAFVAEVPKDGPDRLIALASESIGDFHWDRRGSSNFYMAWQHYQLALDYWAGRSEIDEARRHYLAIVFRCANPSWHEVRHGYGAYHSYLPREFLVNAQKIAERPEDRAQANFLLGTHWFSQGRSPRSVERALACFAVVEELGKAYEPYDDALFAHGRLLEEIGRVTKGADGAVTFEPDYVGALRVYRRYEKEIPKGTSQHYMDVRERIRRITAPLVSLRAERFFLADSEIQLRLGWRNVESVRLALYPIDMTRDVRIGTEDERTPPNWLASIDTRRLEPLRAWAHATDDTGEHRPGDEPLVVEPALAVGAYLLEASAGGETSRELVLVGDSTLTVKESQGGLLVWFTDLATGAPLAGADVAYWQRYHDAREWRLGDGRAQTGADGAHLFRTADAARNTQLFVAAKLGDRQAFVLVDGYHHDQGQLEWRIYAYTDRSVYRPLDEVQWKFTARTREEDVYATPGGRELAWHVYDPLGAKTAEGKLKLNAFGSGWGKLATTKAMPLGEYTIHFYDASGSRRLGGDTLFRLEEYKAPEFEVRVRLPEEPEGSGHKKLFVTGDEVGFDVEAGYLWGAPVGNAEVEVFVWQKPFGYAFQRDRAFPWFYEQNDRAMFWGNGNQVLHERLTTDAEGRARVTFETPVDFNQDYEYTIEARVVDASRREITGGGSVRVTRQEHYVTLVAEHAIHSPGARIEVGVNAEDPNGNPVAVKGAWTVERERWIEIWRDPQGRDVSGENLRRLRAGLRVFPPPGGAWRLVRRGTDREVVAKGELATSDKGQARLAFVPPSDGSYRISWRGQDGRGTDVTAAITVQVADEATRELGFLTAGIDILVDKDSVEVGEDAAILLSASTSGRWVLFAVEAEDVLQYEVVRLEGLVKLMRVPITDVHVPNVRLTAISVANAETYQDTEELVVPPTASFLDVDVTHDASSYLPGAEGQLTITVHDHSGEPVSTELGIAVVDDALAGIQGDYAKDPRQFFYGQKRPYRVQTRGTSHMRSFVRLVRGAENEIVDERYAHVGDDKEQKDEYRGEKRVQSLGYAQNVLEESSDYQLGSSMRKAGLSAPRSAPMESDARLGLRKDADDGSPGGAGGGGAVSVRVRSDFRDTALWLPDVVTDANGKATVTVPFPDSTTRWKTTVRAAGKTARFGVGTSSARTRQPLIARLQAPRFFVVGDEALVSGNFDNASETVLTLTPRLEASGLELVGMLVDGRAAEDDLRLDVPASGSRRVDWRVRVTQPGEALLTLTGLSDTHSDAMQRTYPVFAHGIDVLEARSGKFDGPELAFTIPIPAARADGSASLTVQVTPSLAVTMLDALPYLVDYPYGCTEQTLSRFMPSVVVAKTLRELGLSAEDAMTRVFGGIEQEHTGSTQPKGKRALDQLDRMTRDGLQRLYDNQHGDGGFGWWKNDDSDPYMTAYVVWGLALGREAGMDVRAGVLESAARWLADRLVVHSDTPDLQAWMVHALAVAHVGLGDRQAFLETAFVNLTTKKRDQLNAYTRALVALAAVALGHDATARELAEQLWNGVIVDESPDTSMVLRGPQTAQPFTQKTAHWGADRGWRNWSEGGVEATAFALRALLAIDPEHELIEPVTNWLVKNRRGAQWSNTRDTAITVLALNDYLKTSGELERGVSYELLVNGEVVGTSTLTKDELLRAPAVWTVAPERIRDGDNEITIRRTDGAAPLYFAAYAEFFSAEEPVHARGNEVFVRREYTKLVGRPTLLKGYVYDRVPLMDGESVQSGERIEVVLTIEAKNDLEYLVFEDLKPAGFEAVQVKSGESLQARQLKRNEAVRRLGSDDVSTRDERVRGAHLQPSSNEGFTGQGRRVHQELRDRKVALFLAKLPEGTWEIRYDLRAEVPGSFHALPVLGHAMYVPEIRCNGDEIRVTVAE